MEVNNIRIYVSNVTPIIIISDQLITSLDFIPNYSTCYTTDANIVSCTPTSGQTTLTGRKKRESPIDVSYLDLRPIVMLNGEKIDFNDIISPSRVITIIKPSSLILNSKL